MISNSDMISAKVVGRKEDILDMVVVTETDREVQVMHPNQLQGVRPEEAVEVRAQGRYGEGLPAGRGVLPAAAAVSFNFKKRKGASRSGDHFTPLEEHQPGQQAPAT